MPEMIPSTTFTIKLTERECNIVTKALGLLANVEGVRPPTDEEREMAADINRRMLLRERTVYRERLKHAEEKLLRLGLASDEDLPVSDPPSAAPRGWR